MTHKEAIDRMCGCLRQYGWRCFPEVKIGSYGDVIPDIIAIKRSYKKKSIAIFEIKVSRADFQSEIRNRKYMKSLSFADKFYYACPDGMIDVEELPPQAGLYYISDTILEKHYDTGTETYYQCDCMRNAKAEKVELNEDMLWSIILSFETKYILNKKVVSK
jgi:hypothetical protein